MCLKRVISFYFALHLSVFSSPSIWLHHLKAIAFSSFFIFFTSAFILSLLVFFFLPQIIFSNQQKNIHICAAFTVMCNTISYLSISLKLFAKQAAPFIVKMVFFLSKLNKSLTQKVQFIANISFFMRFSFGAKEFFFVRSMWSYMTTTAIDRSIKRKQKPKTNNSVCRWFCASNFIKDSLQKSDEHFAVKSRILSRFVSFYIYLVYWPLCGLTFPFLFGLSWFRSMQFKDNKFSNA